MIVSLNCEEDAKKNIMEKVLNLNIGSEGKLVMCYIFKKCG